MEFPHSFVAFVLVFLVGYPSWTGSSSPDTREPFYNLIYEKPGNLTLAGIFNRSPPGRDCSLRSGKALEEMAAAIWIVEALNRHEFLVPEFKIGLSIYETCQADDEEENEILEAIRETLGNDSLGVLTTLNLRESFEGGDRLSIVPVRHIIDDDVLVNSVVELLVNLQWSTVHGLIADTEAILNKFSAKTSAEKICIQTQVLLNDSCQVEGEHSKLELPSGGVVVVIASSRTVSRVTKLFDLTKEKSDKLILVPTDMISQPAEELPPNSIVLLPAMGDRQILEQFLGSSSRRGDFFNHREPTKSPLFIGIASAVLKALTPLRESLRSTDCSGNGSCHQDVTRVSHGPWISPEDVDAIFQILKLSPNSNGEMFLCIVSVVSGNRTEDAAIIQIYNVKARRFHPVLLKINDDLLGYQYPVEMMTERVSEEKAVEFANPLLDRSPTYETVGKDGDEGHGPDSIPRTNTTSDSTLLCTNFDTGKDADVLESSKWVWRSPTWVTVNTGLGLAGLASTVSILLFVVGRICRGDVLEGSPTFILLLMLSVVVTILSSLSYHVQPVRTDPVTLAWICRVRHLGPSLVYSVLFSLMLSRSIVLAVSEDRNGFVSHVNGYLQTILFLSFAGIQISMSTTPCGNLEPDDPTCRSVHSNNNVVMSQIYNYVLLGLLAGTSPFIIRLHRNYREGLLLSFAGYSVILVWFAWVASYLLLSHEYKDAAAAMGLTSTALIIVIFLFIPRVYLMVAVACRRRTDRSQQVTLPARSSLNFKSRDSVHADTDICETYNIGLSNPNFAP